MLDDTKMIHTVLIVGILLNLEMEKFVWFLGVGSMMAFLYVNIDIFFSFVCSMFVSFPRVSVSIPDDG